MRFGKDGVTDSAIKALQDAFNTRELLKVRVLEGAPDAARDLVNRLTERIPGLQVVKVIGRVLVVYRPHPENPKIQLPAS
jgi:RNA-binding protein